ncbi:MAG TPA: SDR family NAD(P)-dependent oxidoreductase [Candidatus Eremiobacteraceae bacterium]|nr:SDR family NAD(P)-dependent oxidoreductase [Candidatus Eremiobacteraceae bacterium]
MDETQSTNRQPACVIAGAGPRLGLAIAKRYAQAGFASFMLLREPPRIAAQAASMRACDLSIFPLQCDVSNEPALDHAIHIIKNQAESCDVFIYNAFSPSRKHLSLLNAHDIVSDFRVNVAAAVSFSQLAIREMRRRGGAILFSGCGLAQSPSVEQTSLSINKAALRVFVDCLAEETEPQGIRVGIVTIDGDVPNDAAALGCLAELYWKLFECSEHNLTRELRFKVDAGQEQFPIGPEK